MTPVDLRGPTPSQFFISSDDTTKTLRHNAQEDLTLTANRTECHC